MQPEINLRSHTRITDPELIQQADTHLPTVLDEITQTTNLCVAQAPHLTSSLSPPLPTTEGPPALSGKGVDRF